MTKRKNLDPVKKDADDHWDSAFNFLLERGDSSKLLSAMSQCNRVDSMIGETDIHTERIRGYGNSRE